MATCGTCSGEYSAAWGFCKREMLRSSMTNMFVSHHMHGLQQCMTALRPCNPMRDVGSTLQAPQLPWPLPCNQADGRVPGRHS